MPCRLIQDNFYIYIGVPRSSNESSYSPCRYHAPFPRSLFSTSPVLLTTFRIRIEILKSHNEFGEGLVSGVQDTDDPLVMFLIFVSRCGRTGYLIGVGDVVGR
jgi:hypothetical protein